VVECGLLYKNVLWYGILMGSGKRLRSFIKGEKLNVIRGAEEIGNRATGRKCDIPESCVRD
jgi:hypothetical protein